jgi:hypothetical protein
MSDQAIHHIQSAIRIVESLYDKFDDGSIDFDGPVSGCDAVEVLPWIREELYLAKRALAEHVTSDQ